MMISGGVGRPGQWWRRGAWSSRYVWWDVVKFRARDERRYGMHVECYGMHVELLRDARRVVQSLHEMALTRHVEPGLYVARDGVDETRGARIIRCTRWRWRDTWNQDYTLHEMALTRHVEPGLYVARDGVDETRVSWVCALRGHQCVPTWLLLQNGTMLIYASRHHFTSELVFTWAELKAWQNHKQNLAISLI
jgi:hypothetical protein